MFPHAHGSWEAIKYLTIFLPQLTCNTLFASVVAGCVGFASRAVISPSHLAACGSRPEEMIASDELFLNHFNFAQH